MRQFEDLVGRRFNRLFVEAHVGKNKSGKHIWRCRCDCGNYTEVISGHLKRNAIKSCGCFNHDRVLEMNAKKRKYTPGKAKAKDVWRLMIRRCENASDRGYPIYGLAGVKVCEEWHDFERFYKDMGDPPEGKYIDRIDPFGNYDPGNCRWATRKENNRNKKYHRYLEYNGEKKLMVEWAEELGVDRYTLYTRKKLGWTDKETIETTIGKNIKDKEIFIEYNGKIMNLKSWSRELGINYSLLKERNRRGWDVEKMFTLPPTPRSQRVSIGRELTKTRYIKK